MGANPVQVETGEFDEAIEVVEDVIAESKFNVFSTPQTICYCFEAVSYTQVMRLFPLKRFICSLHHAFCRYAGA